MIILYHTIKYNDKLNHNESEQVLYPTDNHNAEYFAH